MDRIVVGHNPASSLFCEQKGAVNAHEQEAFQRKVDAGYGWSGDGISHHGIQLQLMFLAIILVAWTMARGLIAYRQGKSTRIGYVGVSRMIEAHASALAAEQQDHQQDSGDNSHGFDG